MSDTTTYQAPGYLRAKEYEIVPEGVEVLKPFAFGSEYEYGNNCPLRQVILPSTLKKVGAFAFANCKKLESIKIPHGVEEIDEKAFKGCISLTEISFPSTLKKLGMSCLDHCISLHRIIVEDIVSWARVQAHDDFGNWKYSKNKPELWHGDVSLMRFEVPLELVCENVRHNPIAFCAFSNISEVVYPEGTLYADLDFTGCSNLKKVYFPRELKSINLNGFAGCTRLEEIRFPELVSERCLSASASSLGQSRDSEQSRVLDLIPEEDGAKYVGGWCVGGNGETVKIKKGTIGIANRAFEHSKTLREVCIPDSVQLIGREAFFWVFNLSYVRFEGGTPEIMDGAFIPARQADGMGFVSNRIRVIVHDDKITQWNMRRCYLAQAPYSLEYEDESGRCLPLDTGTHVICDYSPQMILQDPIAVLKGDVRRWFNGVLTGGHPRISTILREKGYREEVFLERVAVLVDKTNRDVLDGLTRLDKMADNNPSARQMLHGIVSQLMQ